MIVIHYRGAGGQLNHCCLLTGTILKDIAFFCLGRRGAPWNRSLFFHITWAIAFLICSDSFVILET